jgi:hypothetical protein
MRKVLLVFVLIVSVSYGAHAQWEQLPGSADSELNVFDIHVFKGALWAQCQSGLFVSNDSGQSWSASSPNPRSVQLFLEQFGGKLYSGGFRGLWRYDDTQWTRLIDTQVSRGCFSEGVFLSPIYRSPFPNSALPLILRSSDNGLKWDTMYVYNMKVNSSPQLIGLFAHRQRLFLCLSGYDYYFETDSHGQKIWHNDPASDVMISTDSGNSWTSSFQKGVFEIAPGRTTTTFAALNDSTFFEANEGGIYRCTNSSSTHRSVRVITPSLYPSLSFPACLDTFKGGVVVTTFDSTTSTNRLWLLSNESVQNLDFGHNFGAINTFTSNGKYIYIGTGNSGIWRAPIASLPLAVEARAPMGEFGVTIYPNPSADKATLSFSLPERGHVSVNLYDACGILRNAVFDGEREAGENNLAIETRGLMNGVYQVVLSTAISRRLARLVIAR